MILRESVLFLFIHVDYACTCTITTQTLNSKQFCRVLSNDLNWKNKAYKPNMCIEDAGLQLLLEI